MACIVERSNRKRKVHEFLQTQAKKFHPDYNIPIKTIQTIRIKKRAVIKKKK